MIDWLNRTHDYRADRAAVVLGYDRATGLPNAAGVDLLTVQRRRLACWLLRCGGKGLMTDVARELRVTHPSVVKAVRSMYQFRMDMATSNRAVARLFRAIEEGKELTPAKLGSIYRGLARNPTWNRRWTKQPVRP